ncbi:hypothetical protein NI17_013900 [Thermobifida halotolerans]|uniref:Uncharacterized protein n=1 Tax=Thermobifida halotolerans TaxID=483545 RepID=A0A399G845_9ACTN|nr:hypothetical protein [Thermobifida halotolerans]UOE17954.1 hypothetical protein NI17_013900 [Thermobifida halotolerans]
MRKTLQTAGFLLTLMGVSGAVDHLYVQPVMGIFLNAFNRFVLPRVGFLTGYELYANLSLAVLGVAVMVAAERIRE